MFVTCDGEELNLPRDSKIPDGSCRQGGGFFSYKLVVGLLRVQFPHIDCCILTTAYEAGVVLEPGYSLDGCCVSHEFEIVRQYACVELIDMDIEAALTCEEMASIRKDYFATLFDWQLFI